MFPCIIRTLMGFWYNADTAFDLFSAEIKI